MRGPAAYTEDLGFLKRFGVGERAAEFRVDIINLFNRSGLAGPNTDLSSPNFGKIFGVGQGARRLQLSLQGDVLGRPIPCISGSFFWQSWPRARTARKPRRSRASTYEQRRYDQSALYFARAVTACGASAPLLLALGQAHLLAQHPADALIALDRIPATTRTMCRR